MKYERNVIYYLDVREISLKGNLYSKFLSENNTSLPIDIVRSYMKEAMERQAATRVCLAVVFHCVVPFVICRCYFPNFRWRSVEFSIKAVDLL